MMFTIKRGTCEDEEAERWGWCLSLDDADRSRVREVMVVVETEEEMLLVDGKDGKRQEENGGHFCGKKRTCCRARDIRRKKKVFPL